MNPEIISLHLRPMKSEQGTPADRRALPAAGSPCFRRGGEVRRPDWTKRGIFLLCTPSREGATFAWKELSLSLFGKSIFPPPPLSLPSEGRTYGRLKYCVLPPDSLRICQIVLFSNYTDFLESTRTRS